MLIVSRKCHVSVLQLQSLDLQISQRKNGERLVGFNTENEEVIEGLVRLDIVFYVCMSSVGGRKIGNEYDIPNEESIRKDVSVMCNLSQKIEKKVLRLVKQDSL